MLHQILYGEIPIGIKATIISSNKARNINDVSNYLVSHAKLELFISYRNKNEN
jgi:hypothetical protein